MEEQNKKELFEKAIKLHQNGDLDKADKIYLSVLDQDNDNFAANFLHGCILSDKSEFKESINFFEVALRAQPENFDVNNSLGVAYKNLGDFSKSEKYFIKSITIDSNNYQAYFNCANVYSDMHDYKSAIEFFRNAIKINEDFAEAHQRLGETYQELYKEDKNEKHIINSIECFNIILKKQLSFNIPEFKSNATLISLALSYLWLGDIGNADKYFKELNTKNYNDNQYMASYIDNYLMTEKSITTLITHEYEQLTYIDSDTDEIRNTKFTKEYYQELKELYLSIKNNTFKITDVSENIKAQIPKIIYNKAPKVNSDNLINEKNNIKKLELEYLESNPEVLVVDDFLSSECLHEIQKFCRNANIFKYPYENGYLGAFLARGLSNKFILKLSEDIRLSYKNIFNDTKLVQAWIYKYDSNKRGINIHADPAKINVNFWVTPDEGNLNPDSGGLKVWNKIPPDDWDFHQYNSGVEKMKKFLSDNKSIEQTIPYKENRAVIFNSKLFHSTDEFRFDDSYKNRRLNITFLYE